MKKLAVLLPMAFLIACISAAYSQSLADLAKKEKSAGQKLRTKR